jgi:hypothetical protein
MQKGHGQAAGVGRHRFPPERRGLVRRWLWVEGDHEFRLGAGGRLVGELIVDEQLCE